MGVCRFNPLATPPERVLGEMVRRPRDRPPACDEFRKAYVERYVREHQAGHRPRVMALIGGQVRWVERDRCAPVYLVCGHGPMAIGGASGRCRHSAPTLVGGEPIAAVDARLTGRAARSHRGGAGPSPSSSRRSGRPSGLLAQRSLARRAVPGGRIARWTGWKRQVPAPRRAALSLDTGAESCAGRTLGQGISRNDRPAGRARNVTAGRTTRSALRRSEPRRRCRKSSRPVCGSPPSTAGADSPR